MNLLIPAPTPPSINHPLRGVPWPPASTESAMCSRLLLFLLSHTQRLYRPDLTTRSEWRHFTIGRCKQLQPTARCTSSASRATREARAKAIQTTGILHHSYFGTAFSRWHPKRPCTTFISGLYSNQRRNHALPARYCCLNGFGSRSRCGMDPGQGNGVCATRDGSIPGTRKDTCTLSIPKRAFPNLHEATWRNCQ